MICQTKSTAFWNICTVFCLMHLGSVVPRLYAEAWQPWRVAWAVLVFMLSVYAMGRLLRATQLATLDQVKIHLLSMEEVEG